MKTISSLAWSNIKKDKTRSILITITIFMTTVLLTMIAITGYGIINFNKAIAADLYGSFYGRYKGMTGQQVAEMELRSEFTDMGMLEIFGSVENDRKLYLAWSDEIYRELTNTDKMLMEGHWAEAANEIAAQPSFFQSLGIENPSVGDKVSIPYRVDLDSKYEPKEFVISGFLKDPEEISGTSIAFVSTEYYEKTISEEKRLYDVYFRMDDSLGVNADNGKEMMEEIGQKLGVGAVDVYDNFVYLMWSLDPGTETITVCAVVILLVICFSVIVIYNIFQVEVVQKVQEYGKLKAIGATRRQMLQTVSREGIILAAVGTPAGLIAGFGLSAVTFKWLTNLMYNMRDVSAQISLFSFPLLLFTAVLSFLTVWIALRKPMKIVASISPVEAMRYQGNKGKGKGQRKGKKCLGVSGITMANLTANKRRTLVTIISMGLSCVLFIVLANFIGNMDMKYEARKFVTYGQFQMELNYDMGDRAYPENNLDSILADNPLNQELVEEIRNIEGVTEVGTGNILYTEEVDGAQAKEMFSVQILNREEFEKWYQEGGRLGTFDYDTVTAENGVIYGWSYSMEEKGYSIGQNLTLKAFDGENHKEWQTKIVGGFGTINADLAMTEDTFKNLGFSKNATHFIWADCAAKDVEAVEGRIKALIAGKEHVQMISYQNMYERFRSNMRITRMGGYTVCIIIAFISFMNVANTMITSIVTRKQEFGILQAIGMTNGQLNRSLQMEGILFTAGPVLVSLIVGIPMGYGLFIYGKSNSFAGMYEYHFPVIETACMIIVLATLQIILSFILSKNVKKESLVERIRYRE